MSSCDFGVAEVLPHHDAILAVLQGIQGTLPSGGYLGVYDGEVNDSPVLDGDGRVRPYVVLRAGPAYPCGQVLAGAFSVLDYRFGVACVGGDQRRCLWAMDRVNGALISQRLTVPGRLSGLVYPGPASPPVERVDPIAPPRYVAALLFDVLTS